MSESSAAASRLRAIQAHMPKTTVSPAASSPPPSPSLSSSSSSSLSSPSPPPDGPKKPAIDFSVLAQCMPEEGNVTTATSLWYVVATATLLSFHQEKAVGQLWKYIDSSLPNGTDVNTRATIARRIRETCLKASVLVGFPRAINSLASLHSALRKHSPEISSLLDADTSLRAPISQSEKLRRGHHFFSQIYSTHTSRIISNMSTSSGGDLSDFAIRCVYGELMGEMRILNEMETVMLEFVCCLGDGVGPQAKGHFFGCRNLGATGKQVLGAVELVRAIAAQLGLERPGCGEGFGFLGKAEKW